MICPSCQGSDYYEDDNGYFNCVICGTQSQELFSESFETEQFGGKIIARNPIKLGRKQKKEIPEYNIQDYLEVFQSMLLVLIKSFVEITRDEEIKPTVKKIWFSYLELWSKSDKKMLTSIMSEKIDSKSSETDQNVKDLPVPSKPLLLGMVYLALCIRRSWILPSDIVRWVSDGKIPYTCLYSKIPAHLISHFEQFPHINRVFNRDNLSTTHPITSMNILFHSILISNCLSIPYPCLNGPLLCYSMVLSLGLPYHIIWPIVAKISQLYSPKKAIEELSLYSQYYTEAVVLTVLTACQLSPHWIHTWSYEPLRLLRMKKPENASHFKFNLYDRERVDVENPPVVVEALKKQNKIQDYRDSGCGRKESISLPRSLSEVDYCVNRANLSQFLSQIQTTMRLIDRKTNLGTSDYTGFLSFNQTMETILNHITPSGQTLAQSLSSPSLPSNSSQPFSQFSQFSQYSQSHQPDQQTLQLPSQDHSVYSFGSTIIAGNPIQNSKVPREEDAILRHAYDFPVQPNKKLAEFHSYLTYADCNPEESLSLFHPNYQILIERFAKHFTCTPHYLYSLQHNLDHKFLQICRNIHQSEFRIQVATLQAKVKQLNELSRNIPVTARQITTQTIEKYFHYCNFVFPMLQKLGEENSFRDFELPQQREKSISAVEELQQDENSETEHGDDEEPTKLYGKSMKDRDPYRTRLKSTFVKESNYQNLWENQMLYQTLDRMMTHYDEQGQLHPEVFEKKTRNKRIFSVNDEKSDEGDFIESAALNSDSNEEGKDESKQPGQTSNAKKKIANSVLHNKPLESVQSARKRRRKSQFRLKNGGVPLQPKPAKKENSLHFSESALLAPALSETESLPERPSKRITRSEARLKERYQEEDLPRKGNFQLIEISTSSSDEDFLPSDDNDDLHDSWGRRRPKRNQVQHLVFEKKPRESMRKNRRRKQRPSENFGDLVGYPDHDDLAGELQDYTPIEDRDSMVEQNNPLPESVLEQIRDYGEV